MEYFKIISSFVLAIIAFYVSIMFNHKRLNANLQIIFLLTEISSNH